jgi:hypothetical protein
VQHQSVRPFVGCSCQTNAKDPVSLMARWAIGLTSTPYYHVLDIRSFLSLRLTLQTIFGGSDRFRRIFESLMSIGVVIPIEPRTSSLDKLNRVHIPTVSAVNGQWRVLLSEAAEVPITEAVCIQFMSADVEDVKHWLLDPGKSPTSFRSGKHGDCERCVADACPIVLASASMSLLKYYESSFFRPLTAILETAITNGWGIYSDFFNRETSPLAPTPKAKPIPI